ncbi:dehydratase [Pontibacillus yanchengensis]|uniref:Dehydratase n=2 Tax=Pontibacillus yanchengensis TaxID=462910 RepID=A0ACC7VCG5_9BACI|nr:MaoC/PaaZ C-terminal domain-containing protein [Pontibacillus yanchengensis]MYL32078.1 dehydratase [Pontibacillus yanchengensis]MYL52658.1 dehydratase [Pontibacillus yanchengensis]
MFTKYFDQFQIGDTWTSKGRTITEADLVNFSALSGDWFPLHTDIEYAKETPFKQRVAHGALILSISTGLIDLEPGKVVAFYGIDKLRFIRPTFIHHTIHVELEVVDLDEKDTTGVVTVREKIVNQEGETAVDGVLKLLVNKE